MKGSDVVGGVIVPPAVCSPEVNVAWPGPVVLTWVQVSLASTLVV